MEQAGKRSGICAIKFIRFLHDATLKMARAKWKALSEAERAKWQAQYDKDMQAFEAPGGVKAPIERKRKGEAPVAASDASALVGSVARISGLRALPELNGQLCHVLRLADSADRVVVRTSLGEKSLKPVNLLSGVNRTVALQKTFLIFH